MMTIVNTQFDSLFIEPVQDLMPFQNPLGYLPI
jgi:hypothetical protein